MLICFKKTCQLGLFKAQEGTLTAKAELIVDVENE